jgi:glutamate-1-semialdehyde 2,1-aminomutase
MILKIDNSLKFKEKGSFLLPSLAQTFSKSPSSFVEGVYPVYAEKADGCFLYDVDGNKFVDYLMALGPIVLGYNYPSVVNAVKKQLDKGSIFSLPHTLEIEAADALNQIIPCAEMTRFTKTGSDAVTGAVRAVRAITKKNIILYCGSGGVWDDWYSITTSRNNGIPSFNKNLIDVFDYNNLEQLEQLFQKYKDKVAAVIMEPSIYEKPKNDFLNKVKDLTHENNALLVFDEILTGFRLANGGGQEFFNVIPDMATFAKGIANGMPLGAIVGKSEYMKIFDDIFVSTTYGGEALSLAACVATINEFEKNDVIKHMWNLSNKMRSGFNTLAKKYELNAECIGFSPRLKLLFKDQDENDSLLYKSLFLQNLIENGIFMHPNTILFSYSHSTIEINKTLDEIDKSLSNLSKAIHEDFVLKKLKGNVVKTVIKQIKD